MNEFEKKQTDYKDRKQVDEVEDVLAEFYQNVERNMLIKTNTRLSKYKNLNAEEWKKKQLDDLKKFKKELVKEGKETVESMDKLVVSASSMLKIKPIKVENKKGMALLIGSALRRHEEDIIKVYKLFKTQPNTPIYDSIVKYTDKGIDQGLKVVYKDKRQIGYKEYMEMNVRTTMQQEILENMKEIGKELNLVFYTTTTYGDCADDHADYQGKIYYDETSALTEEEENYIKENNIQSLQEVSSGEPYLCTRPNCRHNFIPITIEQVKNLKATQKDLNLKKGNYKPENYQLMQQQRYNERMIRKYSDKVQTYKNMPQSNERDKFLNQANYRLNKWNEYQSNFCEKNHLKRDPRRETRNVLLNDLGVKYSKGL